MLVGFAVRDLAVLLVELIEQLCPGPNWPARAERHTNSMNSRDPESELSPSLAVRNYVGQRSLLRRTKVEDVLAAEFACREDRVGKGADGTQAGWQRRKVAMFCDVGEHLGGCI